MTFEDARNKVERKFKSSRYWGEYSGGQRYWGFRGGFVHFNPDTGTLKIHRKDKPTEDL